MKIRFVALACMLLLGVCAGSASADRFKTVVDAAKALDDKDLTTQTKLEAVNTLRSFGPKAEPALPDLKKYLAATDDDNVRSAVITAYGAIGKAAVPALLDALSDKKIDHLLVIASLSQVGADARDAAPALLKMLKADDLNARYAQDLFQTLRGIDADPNDVAPAALEVAKRFNDKTDVTIYPTIHAIHTLEWAGPAAKDAVPYLISNLARDPNNSFSSGIIRDSIHALGAIGPDAKPALDPLRALLKSPTYGQDAEAAITKIKATKDKK